MNLRLISLAALWAVIGCAHASTKNEIVAVAGHRIVGMGPQHVIIMHDWFSDCSSYEPIIAYLDTETFTYAFIDLRGYGKSKTVPGKYDANEASRDAIALADFLKWERFHVVGHSMSGMIAQRIMANAESRVQSIVAIAPSPASGFPKPPEVMAFLEDAARANDASAAEIAKFLTSNRYTSRFIEFKVRNWRETSLPEARVAYLHMFSDTDFSTEVRGIQTPILVVTGEFDAEVGREQPMRKAFRASYPNVEFVELGGSGHYPMQEVPVLLTTVMENFMKSIGSQKSRIATGRG